MTRQRPRGFVQNWQPRSTGPLLEQIEEVLAEYSAQLPMTSRQIFYRLVGKHSYAKDERAYARLCELLVTARRAGRIPFESIRDDGPQVMAPALFLSADHWLENMRYHAERMRLSPWESQQQYVEVICEAGGMVPMLARVADPFGITVRSGGGFDSLTAKHSLAKHFASMDAPCLVLHIGDYDASGEALWQNLAEDVGAFVDAMGGSLRVERIAVTPDHQRLYNLATAPPKKTDNRGSVFSSDFTVQAEALPPDILQSILLEAIEMEMDLDALADVRAAEADVRAALAHRVAGLIDS